MTRRAIHVDRAHSRAHAAAIYLPFSVSAPLLNCYTGRVRAHLRGRSHPLEEIASILRQALQVTPQQRISRRSLDERVAEKFAYIRDSHCETQTRPRLLSH